MRGLSICLCVLLLIGTTACGTGDDVAPAPRDAESLAFADVLVLWNADGSGDGADTYAPDAKIVRTELIFARGIDEISSALVTSRDAGFRADLLGIPTVVLKTDSANRYAIAAVTSRVSDGSEDALEIVVLKWESEKVKSHWWLPVPAAKGDFRVEENPAAVESAYQMTAAWNGVDNSGALEIYAPDVRVYWWGTPEPTGFEDLISNVEGARSIANRYEDIAPPIVLADESSGRVFTVNVSNVRGPGHVNGSLVIAVSELQDGKITAWTPYLVEDLPAG